MITSEPQRRQRPYDELCDEITRLAARGGGIIKIPEPTTWTRPDGRIALSLACRQRIHVYRDSFADGRGMSHLWFDGAYSLPERAKVRLKRARWRMRQALEETA